MNQVEIAAMMKQIAPVVREYVSRQVDPLLKRIEYLESKEPKNGQDGKDADPKVISSLIDEGIKSHFATLSKMHDELADSCRAKIDKAISDIPEPIPGEPGKPGEDGKSVTLDDLKPVIASALEEIRKSMPEPKDPISLVNATIDREKNLILTLSNGSEKNLGVVVGKDGEPGKPGRDGFSLEDFSASVSDDFKTVTLKFESGDVKKVAELIFPITVYREIYKEGTTYERGDSVTFGGSLWICVKETTGKPGVSSDWRLAVKRGRDAKEPVSAR